MRKVIATTIAVTMLLSMLMIVSVPSAKAAGSYQYVTQWGSSGPGDGQFYAPYGMAVDPSGNVYVSDNTNHIGYNRIEKFNDSGAFIASWGTTGSGQKEFQAPIGVAVDPSGNVYVADTGNHRIQKFDSTGDFITAWGGYGTGDGQFRDPYGIDVGRSGDVYVTDTTNNRIEEFNDSGAFIRTWGSAGTGDGQFMSPVGVAVDPSGNVYVTDNTNRVQKFNDRGTFIRTWGATGSGDGQFGGLMGDGITADSAGYVYVTDENDRVQKFDGDGMFITAWGTRGTGDGQFMDPRGIAVDPSGNVFVADTTIARAQKFAPPDTTPPVITSYGPTAQVKAFSEVPYLTVSYSDARSGIDTGSVKVLIDGVDHTSDAIVTASGVQYPLAKLPAGPGANEVPKGQYSITVVVSDMAGNTATVSWDIHLTGSAYKK